jgi:hypothetical protein
MNALEKFYQRCKPNYAGFPARWQMRRRISADKWFELRVPIETMNFIEFIAPDMKDDNSPLADIGYYLQNIDGCAVTAEAIEYALGKLPVRDRWCVEFGAGDDLHGSTTNRLIENQQYSAVLIEGSREKFKVLQNCYAGRPNIITKNLFVGSSATDGLDAILTGMPIPPDFDFLSVDIDGNDYHAWNAILEYRPKIVMVEFNPTIPPEVHFVQPADPAINWGSSLTALVELGKKKDYELIGVIGVNALFAEKKYYPLFGIVDNRPQTLWTKRDCVTYMFCGFDGRIFLRGCQKLPWHYNIPIREADAQVFPKFLQKYAFTRTDKRVFETLKNPFRFACDVFWRLIKK